MSSPASARQVYFSDVFGVSTETLDEYGAFDIALVNDLPLFIDPFLLYDSEDAKYRQLHDDIIHYLVFLRDRVLERELTAGELSHWLFFPEVRQNWLGFSKTGNHGTGLGNDFARGLCRNLATVFKNFGEETLTHDSHLEKLSLIDGGVGRDHLSDFTTNLTKLFLLEYTQSFAKKHLSPGRVHRFHVAKVTFDYETRRWRGGHFDLPLFNGDFVLLTPKEILTRDEAWINHGDMVARFASIRDALPDAVLRAQVNDHFFAQINELSQAEERRDAARATIARYPEILDYYIKEKEESAPEAHSISNRKVHETEVQFVENVRTLVNDHLLGGGFYELGDSYDESLKRVAYLKHVIEDNDGYRLFYVDGKPIKRESDLQTMFRLTWYETSFDVNAEVNNGRGPVDFKVSKGRRNLSLVEFKLASNTGLKRNLENQVKIYERANAADKSIKVILHFNEAELDKVMAILRSLNLEGGEDIILIDACYENKASASKARSH